ncbi:ribulokinase [Yeguia hominis]|uniref:Ribulokinase n=1 Tax=Yeguia hominis TaxID=2763662 RepID=A0A926HSA3_9FIRM|nr:ribulokinase [Yeguia hominis]MBC8533166.1 ribulokinase [Yeguia hominis]
MRTYAIGVDFGTDSARAAVVESRTGALLGSGAAEYPRWKAQCCCDPANQIFRQHPQDFLDALVSCVRQALEASGKDACRRVCGIAVDTTGSTPAPVDADGVPLAMYPEFSENPDAMFWLWKDHSAVQEAKELDAALAKGGAVDYTQYQGVYSSEWYWAKLLRALRNGTGIRERLCSWVEHSDWIPGVLTGNTRPQTLHRNACAAGHKALWHSAFGGLPDAARLSMLDPDLCRIAQTFRAPEAAGTAIGTLCSEWADRLGLLPDTVVGTGSFDAHAGAVGAGIAPGTLVKVLGTSTVDLLVTRPELLKGKRLGTICGQAEQSILPGYVGVEAGQAAFGDLFSWYRRLLSWPLAQDFARPWISETAAAELSAALLSQLDRAAQTAPWDPHLLTLDWFAGRRYPGIDETATGAMFGLTLSSSAVQVYQSLALSAVFGSRRIFDSFLQNGLSVSEIYALGGIAGKSPFVMQLMADVLARPIRICAAPQACALGAAMAAATAAGCYASLSDAQTGMSAGFSKIYTPSESRHAVLEPYYRRYCSAARKMEEEGRF